MQELYADRRSTTSGDLAGNFSALNFARNPPWLARELAAVLGSRPDQRLRRWYGGTGANGFPLIGAQEFKIASTTIVVSFIVSFGVVKAVANLVSGHFADVFGRKHMLVLGWLVGLPVPFMIAWGPSWGWVVAANALLGINQGFAWSMTVIMKVDLVGPKSRGLAVGLNEFAGYLSVGITAFLTGYIAERYGLRPEPFYLGIAYAALGVSLSILLVRDTRHHVALEVSRHATSVEKVGFWEIFRRASFGKRNLFEDQSRAVAILQIGWMDDDVQ